MHRPHVLAGVFAAAVVTFLTSTAHAQSKDLTLTANADATMHFREGWSAVEQNDVEGAVKHLKMALDRDANFGLARAMYVWQGGGSFASQDGELNRAVADAAKGGTGELLLAMAFREATKNRAANATALLRAAQEIVPGDPFIALSAFQFAPAGDRKAALMAANDLVAKYPDYGPGYNMLAYTAWNAGDHPAALNAAMKQVQLIPKYPNPHDSYAELLQWSGKLPEALTHYQEAVTIDPSFAEGYIGMAEVEALQGHYDKARAAINQAMAHSSVPAAKLTYMRDIAGTYALEGNTKAADAALTAAAKEAMAQGNKRIAAIVYSQLAASSARAGDAKAAHSYLAMAKSTYAEPTAPIGFYAAMAHGMLKHWEPANAAIAEAKAAPDATPLAGRIAAAEAFLATSQGKSADAIALLSSADLTDPLIAGRLAEAYAAAGKKVEAAKLQQQVMNDNTLTLVDWPAVNARYRARTSMVVAKKK